MASTSVSYKLPDWATPTWLARVEQGGDREAVKNIRATMSLIFSSKMHKKSSISNSFRNRYTLYLIPYSSSVMIFFGI